MLTKQKDLNNENTSFLFTVLPTTPRAAILKLAL